MESYEPNSCDGYPTELRIHPNNLPGYVCITQPVGTHGVDRFRECCWGEVYNITEPTTPDHPAYPVSCGLVCQVHPSWEGPNYNNPIGYSDLFMCWTDGGRLDGVELGDSWCWMNSLADEPAPTSFPSTPVWDDWTSYWSYYPDTVIGSVWPTDHPFRTNWYRLADSPSGILVQSSTGFISETVSIVPTPSQTRFASTSASTLSSESPSTTSAPTSSPLEMAEEAIPTSRAAGRGVNRLAKALFVLFLLYAGSNPI
ncbi:hypothetical protein BDV12DRAFT_174824 [Aspergillus spectabilis]